MNMASNGFKSNPYITDDMDDILYHFGIGKFSHNLPKIFGDVKFVCCGGTKGRMEKLAVYLNDLLASNLDLPKEKPKDYSLNERYSIFKVGPVLCVNHGIGAPSLSVILVEIFKLLHHSQCSKNVQFFRVGTSGGIGVDPGTVVVANGALNGLLEPFHMQYILGELVKWPAPVNSELSQDIQELGKTMDFLVDTGITMCCDDFYEGQGRLDGAFCEYSEKEKMAFLEKCADAGVRNIEMESTCFASMCYRANIKAAIVCVTLVNRLNGDQISTPTHILKQWENRPIQLVAQYIKNCLTGLQK